jgi:hypothetical protein
MHLCVRSLCASTLYALYPLVVRVYRAPPAADWRLQTILQYRIARKRALRHTLEKIAGHLGRLGREDVVNAGGEQAGQHEATGGFTSGDDGGSGEL